MNTAEFLALLPQTGDQRGHDGVHAAFCDCNYEILPKAGQPLPQCPLCRRSVKWLPLSDPSQPGPGKPLHRALHPPDPIRMC